MQHFPPHKPSNAGFTSIVVLLFGVVVFLFLAGVLAITLSEVAANQDELESFEARNIEQGFKAAVASSIQRCYTPQNAPNGNVTTTISTFSSMLHNTVSSSMAPSYWTVTSLTGQFSSSLIPFDPSASFTTPNDLALAPLAQFGPMRLVTPTTPCTLTIKNNRTGALRTFSPSVTVYEVPVNRLNFYSHQSNPAGSSSFGLEGVAFSRTNFGTSPRPTLLTPGSRIFGLFTQDGTTSTNWQSIITNVNQAYRGSLPILTQPASVSYGSGISWIYYLVTHLNSVGDTTPSSYSRGYVYVYDNVPDVEVWSAQSGQGLAYTSPAPAGISVQTYNGTPFVVLDLNLIQLQYLYIDVPAVGINVLVKGATQDGAPTSPIYLGFGSYIASTTNLYLQGDNTKRLAFIALSAGPNANGNGSITNLNLCSKAWSVGTTGTAAVATVWRGGLCDSIWNDGSTGTIPLLNSPEIWSGTSPFIIEGSLTMTASPEYLDGTVPLQVRPDASATADNGFGRLMGVLVR